MSWPDCFCNNNTERKDLHVEDDHIFKYLNNYFPRLLFSKTLCIDILQGATSLLPIGHGKQRGGEEREEEEEEKGEEGRGAGQGRM